MGLKRMSAESGMETPSIFTDPAYAQSITHDLSTSQVVLVECSDGPGVAHLETILYNLPQYTPYFGSLLCIL